MTQTWTDVPTGELSSADGSSDLTATQRRVMRDLLDRGGTVRPVARDDLADDLRAELEEQLAPVADAAALRPDRPLVVSKHRLTQVLGCERRFQAEDAEPFAWTPATARGQVAHKAVELGIGGRRDFGPAELVDLALHRLTEDPDSGLAEWLRVIDPDDADDLRRSALDTVAKWTDSFPPLSRTWKPQVETSRKALLCGDRIKAQGRIDLVLGQPVGRQSRSLFLDLKTGSPSPTHAPDLRFYALLETLRCGTPPWRLATFLLDSGTWQHEDVTEDLLWGAVARLVEGVHRMAELGRGRAPRTQPGPGCRWCPERAVCADAADHEGDLPHR